QPGCLLTESAIQSLEHYAWPGNVRELENVMQRAVILGEGVVESAHLNLPEASPDGAAVGNTPETNITSLRDIKSLEREYILQTLAAVNGSRKLAVQKLGIS